MAITISDISPRIQYTATAGQTSFTVPFEFFDDDDLVVVNTSSGGVDTTLTKAASPSTVTQYSVTGAGVTGGGSITLGAGATLNDTYTITRNVPIARSTDFATTGVFPIDSLNTELDKIVAMMQQQGVDINLSPRAASTTSTAYGLIFPELTANKVLSVNNDGDTLIFTQEIGNYKDDWAASTAYVQRDLVKDTSNGNIYIVNTAHTSSGSQPLSSNTNSSYYDLIVDAESATTSATNAATSATAAASSATAAATSATNAATSETNAATSESNASTSETNASTSATNASNSATAAATSATNAATSESNASTSETNAATSATNAASSATSAASSATTATTQASAASTSATNAATSETNAATSASNASTSETNAATSASNASTSETNASNSATSASTSATNAANSAAAAEATFDLFDDSYLGAKASNPSLDNDGNALQDGALYFDTTNNVMKVYDLATTTWLQLTPTVSNQTNINTVAGISSDVSTVAGISSDVTTTAGISSNISTVAGISSNVTTVAGDTANIGTIATNLTGTDTIGTVAANISNVNAVGGISANVTTVAGISSDVTAVASDATDIGTVATNIANVNSVGGSIANVNTVASNIVGVNSFAERYRVESSDPSTSLDAGDLVFNTTASALKYYDGSSWQQIVAGSLTDVVQDGTPQLGGNLDLNSNDITGTGNINITGNVSLTGTVDGRDVATDGTKLDGIATSATANPNAIDNLVEDLTPQLGGALSTNGNNINFGDNDKAQFGASQDLQVFHDGSNSYIIDNGTGNLIIRGVNLDFQSTSGEDYINCTNNGGVTLRYDTAGKLSTTSGGVTVTGTLTADAISLGDNEKAQFGAGNDLQIYHTGGQSYIQDVGTGQLNLASNGLGVDITKGTTEYMGRFLIDGAVELYHNNNKKFETTSGGATVTGTMTATAFSGDGSALTGITTGISWQSTPKTANFTASANEGYYVNTTSSSVTMTLPSSPSVNDEIGVIDFSGTFNTNKLIIDPNSLKIEGGTGSKQCTVNRAGIVFIYTGTTQGWVIKTSNSANVIEGLAYDISYLVIAGGGSATSGDVGGGGAGGYRNSYASETSGRNSSTETPITLSGGVNITVTVGAGSSGWGNGSDSSISGSGFTTITSIGGGKGAGSAAANSGGCGGGCADTARGGVAGSGTTGQGFGGGVGASDFSSYTSAGGGGGAGQAGQNSSGNTGGNGGNGLASSITGSSVYRSGGGGGEGGNTPSGGLGGGGDEGSSGTANTGGGGGGGAVTNGGSGVVILRFPTASYSGTTTGSPTVTTSGSDTILTFTGSGSYTT